jgi:hypothetical protein
MLLPSYQQAIAIASTLTVLDQATGQRVPFRLNREQRRILKAALAHRRLIVGKGRQVGCSTVLAFLLMLVCILNPGLPCCIVADEQEKASGLLRRVKGWLKQLGCPLLVDNVESIELGNGSSIDALSAISTAEEGESRVGRSKPYAIIHATEQSFWRNARAVWASLTSTMLSIGRIWNESTGAPGETLFRGIFDEPHGWERLFFGVEQHHNYRAPADSITDEEWDMLAATYGFTERESAAWWWHKLRTDIQEVSRMLREYPVTPAHMFTFREGQHVSKWTETKVISVDDWDFYVEPKTNDEGVDTFGEPVVLGIDTSAGLGKDSSSLGLVGHRTGQVLATWRRNDMTIPAFISFIRGVLKRFAPVAIVIESNAVGQAVWQAFAGHLGAHEQKSGNSDGEVQVRRDELRHAIESGEVLVGGHLLDEVQSSTIGAKRMADGRVKAVFEGRDDTLSAVSFARKWRKENPWRAPAAELDRERMQIMQRLKSKRKQSTSAW